MTTMRLLDQQISLLKYLTSGAAIFGDTGDAPLDPALHGIDRGLLRLESRLSYEKRMEKIATVFPRTFEMLGSNRASIINGFVETCPPVDISRLVNARQFHEYLAACWRRDPSDPPYLRDVADCELAYAKVRVHAEERGAKATTDTTVPLRRSIRRYPGLLLVRCAYDIRPMFEESAVGVAPIMRDTPLAIVMPPGVEHPQVFEVFPVVFDLLAGLDDWINLAAFGATPELGELVANLAEHGLLEVSG